MEGFTLAATSDAGRGPWRSRGAGFGQTCPRSFQQQQQYCWKLLLCIDFKDQRRAFRCTKGHRKPRIISLIERADSGRRGRFHRHSNRASCWTVSRSILSNPGTHRGGEEGRESARIVILSCLMKIFGCARMLPDTCVLAFLYEARRKSIAKQHRSSCPT